MPIDLNKLDMQLSALEKQELIPIVTPIWKNIIDASRDGDYVKFSRGFTDQLKQQITEELFTQSLKDFPLLSSIKDDFEFIDLISRANSYSLLWRISSSELEGEFLGILTLLNTESGIRIAGVSAS